MSTSARTWHLLTVAVAVIPLLLQLALILGGDNILDSTAAGRGGAAAWLVCTLALGPFVGWYPYTFLDVAKIGYGSTLLNCALIAVLFLGLGALALWADRRLSRRRATMIA